MIETYSAALAPGTILNKEKQARCYLTFAVLYNVCYLNPTPVDVCMYSQYLANKFQSVFSVKDYISGARSWIMEHGGSIASFTGHEHPTMVKALTKLSQHVVKRAFPLKVTHLSKICSILDCAQNAPLAIKACILIGYSCYLRSSNLNLSPLGGPHTLLAKNVIDCGASLRVIVNSTKTTHTPYSLIVPTCEHSHLCPVNAWRKYVSVMKLRPNDPAFLLSNRNPVNPALVVSVMHDALSGQPDIDVKLITMHSLRRGAAQQAENQGFSISDIMARGAWASKFGIKPYLAK